MRWPETTAVLFRRQRREQRGTRPDSGDLLLHFDCSQLALDGGEVRDRRVATLRRAVTAASEVHVLTLWAPRDVLLARVDRRIDERALEHPNRPRVIPARRWLVESDENVRTVYAIWFDFLDGLPLTTSWAVNSATYTGAFEPASKWIARGMAGLTGPGEPHPSYGGIDAGDRATSE